MTNHDMPRAHPIELVAGMVRAIVARMSYLPHLVDPQTPGSDWHTIEWDRLRHPEDATISLYARDRDYHKVLCQRLQKPVEKIAGAIGPYGFRMFIDLAPILGVALAINGDLGYRGEHTLLLDRDASSMFFLGEILIDLPSPVDPPVKPHCSNCTHRIGACPAQAIVVPYMVGARHCISYLTVEHKGNIPVGLRPAVGNHVHGCDDCQFICPWSKFTVPAGLADFDVRDGLDVTTLVGLFSQTNTEFNQRLEGSSIRRIGRERQPHNIAVVIGNALRGSLLDTTRTLLTVTLHACTDGVSEFVCEHATWTFAQ